MHDAFDTLVWNLVLDFLILKWYFQHNFSDFLDFRGLKWVFPVFEMKKKTFQMQENSFQDRVTRGNSAEIAEIVVIVDITRKVPCQNKEI